MIRYVWQAASSAVHRVVDLPVPLARNHFRGVMSLALDGEPLGPVFEVQVVNVDGLLADVRSELEEVGIRLVCAVDECVGVARRHAWAIVVGEGEAVFPIAGHALDAQQMLASAGEPLSETEGIDGLPDVVPGVGVEVAATEGDASLHGKVDLVGRRFPGGVVLNNALQPAAFHRTHLPPVQADDVLAAFRNGHLHVCEREVAIVNMVGTCEERVTPLVVEGFVTTTRKMNHGAFGIVVGPSDREAEHFGVGLQRGEKHRHPPVPVLAAEAVDIVITREQNDRSALLRQFPPACQQIDSLLKYQFVVMSGAYEVGLFLVGFQRVLGGNQDGILIMQYVLSLDACNCQKRSQESA